MQKKIPTAWLFTDSIYMDVIEAAKTLPRGSGIILRDYDLPREKKLQLGLELKKLCIGKNFPLLVANDPLLALKLKADGIHLPQYAANKISFWRRKKPYWIITAAVHSPVSLRNAAKNGADIAFLSPIFATKSHPKRKPLGILRATKYIMSVKESAMAVYALGGVKTTHGKSLKMARFKGFGGISWCKN